MSPTLLAFLLSLLAGSGPSTSPGEPADPLALAAPLVGRWVADPDPRAPGVTGWTVFEREAQGRALVRRNHASYPPTKEQPARTHDDVMLLFSESGQLRADYVDSEGHVIRYLVHAEGASTLVFVSEGAASGPRFRLTYRWPEKDRLDLLFEIAPPGGTGQFAPYIQAHLHR